MIGLRWFAAVPLALCSEHFPGFSVQVLGVGLFRAGLGYRLLARGPAKQREGRTGQSLRQCGIDPDHERQDCRANSDKSDHSRPPRAINPSPPRRSARPWTSNHHWHQALPRMNVPGSTPELPSWLRPHCSRVTTHLCAVSARNRIENGKRPRGLSSSRQQAASAVLNLVQVQADPVYLRTRVQETLPFRSSGDEAGVRVAVEGSFVPGQTAETMRRAEAEH
jgi:hypothetical protein